MVEVYKPMQMTNFGLFRGWSDGKIIPFYIKKRSCHKEATPKDEKVTKT